MYLALLLTGSIFLIIIVGLLLIFFSRRRKSPDQFIEPVRRTPEISSFQPPFEQTNSSYSPPSLTDIRQRDTNSRPSFQQKTRQANSNPGNTPPRLSPDFRYTSPTSQASGFNFSVPPEMQHKTIEPTPRSLQQLKSVYERGISVYYDDKLDAAFLIFIDCAMFTRAEVDLGFATVTGKLRATLASKKLERCAWIADIGGLTIGKDVTKEWGEGLKTLLETLSIKIGKDSYLVARYNSQSSQTGTEEIRQKVRDIQFMTAAVINKFQSNIFATREEAIAFLLRQRELTN